MAPASYSQRYCAFIDILGFGSLISDLERGKVSADEIHGVLSMVHARPNTERPQEADLRHQSISDAVALSAAPNAAGFDAICTAAEGLSRRLLRSGYFARGGISKGTLVSRLQHGLRPCPYRCVSAREPDREISSNCHTSCCRSRWGGLR